MLALNFVTVPFLRESKGQEFSFGAVKQLEVILQEFDPWVYSEG